MLARPSEIDEECETEVGREVPSSEVPTRASIPSQKAASGHGVELPGPGTVLDGKYQVLRLLGGGSMGIVTLCRDLDLDRSVAIKVVRPEMLDNARARGRFRTEARAMARLDHPNVVRVYAFGEHAGMPYLVMEYVPGGGLDALLRARRGAPIKIDEAIAIFDQVCRGVSAIHASGALHRDLKPSNVLVGPAFRVVVADLGLARLVSDLRGGDPIGISGTPAYMAPEILARVPVPTSLAARADVYSLGVMAFQMLTGELPFPMTVGGLADRIDTAAPLPPSAYNPALPPAVDDAIIAALARHPENRTHSADALRRALFDGHLKATRSVGQKESSVTKANPARIMIADDDPGYCDLMSMVLARTFPRTVVECHPDGQSALTAIQHRVPDLLITDLDMPGLNGIEVTAMIRSQQRTRGLPIIVATAVGGPTDWTLLSRLGADGFLSKPFDPAQLVTLARGVIERRQGV